MDFGNCEYPIAIDKDGPGSGETCQAYGVQGFPSAFLVDHEGHILSVEQGKFLAALVPLLKKAGAEDVASVSLDHPRISNEMYREIHKTWIGIVNKAPREGSIEGGVVDEKGKPYPHADVEARLFLTMVSAANTHVHTLYWHGQSHKAKTASDGSFKFNGLPKGAYQLTVSAPGRASVEVQSVVDPQTDPQAAARVTAVLDHPDWLAGTVVNEEGRPIAAAQVTLRIHHIERTRNFMQEIGRTDGEGRFRFEKLAAGAYTFDIQVPGYAKATLASKRVGSDLRISLQKE